MDPLPRATWLHGNAVTHAVMTMDLVVITDLATTMALVTTMVPATKVAPLLGLPKAKARVVIMVTDLKADILPLALRRVLLLGNNRLLLVDNLLTEDMEDTVDTRLILLAWDLLVLPLLVWARHLPRLACLPCILELLAALPLLPLPATHHLHLLRATCLPHPHPHSEEWVYLRSICVKLLDSALRKWFTGRCKDLIDTRINLNSPRFLANSCYKEKAINSSLLGHVE